MRPLQAADVAEGVRPRVAVPWRIRLLADSDAVKNDGDEQLQGDLFDYGTSAGFVGFPKRVGGVTTE